MDGAMINQETVYPQDAFPDLQVEDASLEQAKARITIQGPSGTGKTFSALKLALGLTDDIQNVGVIDTENRSASKYVPIFGRFKVVNLPPPFSPERYIAAMGLLVGQGIEVLIVDSSTHEWAGKGGVLELVDGLKGPRNDSHAAWGIMTPRHNKFIETMIRCPIHLLVTTRSKTEYVREKNEQTGKTVIRKVGLGSIQRDGFEYEFDVVFDIDMDHTMKVFKTRFSVLDGQSYARPDEQLGKLILSQVDSGAPMVEIPRLISRDQMDDHLVVEWQRVARASKDHELEVLMFQFPIYTSTLRGLIDTMIEALKAAEEQSPAEDVAPSEMAPEVEA